MTDDAYIYDEEVMILDAAAAARFGFDAFIQVELRCIEPSVPDSGPSWSREPGAPAKWALDGIYIRVGDHIVPAPAGFDGRDDLISRAIESANEEARI